jgi:hypothetical protein
MFMSNKDELEKGTKGMHTGVCWEKQKVTNKKT